MKLALAHPERLAREAVRRSLDLQTEHELLWSVADGENLERQLQRQPPALLLLAPTFCAADAALVQRCVAREVAVLLLTADPALDAVYAAMGAGALGVLEPPHLESNGELVGAARLQQRLARVASLIPAQHRSALAAAASAPALQAGPACRLLALGASTGGPLALAQVLGQLPSALPAAVLIVQHIDAAFSGGLAEWLSGQCALPVRIAEAGDWPLAGQVYVGGPRGHLIMQSSGRLAYRAPLPGDLHVPSVDVLFESLARHARAGAAALLTGMGCDGAEGLAQLRQAGWHTVAQDEASSAVYGMPRAAVERQAACSVLPLTQIGAHLARTIHDKAQRRSE